MSDGNKTLFKTMQYHSSSFRIIQHRVPNAFNMSNAASIPVVLRGNSNAMSPVKLSCSAPSLMMSLDKHVKDWGRGCVERS